MIRAELHIKIDVPEDRAHLPAVGEHVKITGLVLEDQVDAIDVTSYLYDGLEFLPGRRIVTVIVERVERVERSPGAVAE